MIDLVSGTLLIVILGMLGIFWFLFPRIIWIQLRGLARHLRDLNLIARNLGQAAVRVANSVQPRAEVPVGTIIE